MDILPGDRGILTGQGNIRNIFLEIARALRKVKIKHFTVIYLILLLTVSAFVFRELDGFLKGILIMALSAAFDAAWTYARKKTLFLSHSAVISGAILALAGPLDPAPSLIIGLPLLAVAAKQTFFFGKRRHVVNPAALALAVMSLVTPAVSWWGVAWGGWSLLLIGAGGAFIVWLQRRWGIVFSFFLSFSLSLGLLFIINEIPPVRILPFLYPQIVDGTVLFFATVMLIEPITSSFPFSRQRVWYGIFAGLGATLMTYLGGRFGWENQDPLIYGLLAANILGSLLFLPGVRVKR